MKRLALVMPILCTWALHAGPVGLVEFVAKPDYLMAGRRVPVPVRYRVPPDRGTVTLRLEVKATGYHQIETRPIEGEGTISIHAIVPTLATDSQCRLVLWIGEDWQNPLAGLVYSGVISVVSPQRAQRYEAGRREAADLLATLPAGTRRVGVFVGDAPWADALIRDLERRTDGYTVERVPPRWLDNPFALTPELFELIILCNPTAVPVGARQALPRYLDRGGRLMVLGALPFRKALWQHQGEWLVFEEYRERLVPRLKPSVVMPFDDDRHEWVRASNDLTPPSTIRVEDGQLHLHVANLTAWDTFQTSVEGLPGGADACVYLRGRGDEATTQVAIELREADGSRWIAAVTLKPVFEPILVPLSQFRYWRDSESRDRGGAGDHVRLSEVRSIGIGFAHTHTHDVRNGPHHVWLDDIGTATPGPDVDLAAFAPGGTAEPILETVSPHYKTYPVTNAARTRMNPMQAIVPALTVQPRALRSPVARPQGTGFNKGRTFRYIPLIDVLDADDRVVGAAASLLLYNASKQNGMIASVPVGDPGFFASTLTRQWLAALAARMLDGAFLFEGGAEYYAGFGDEEMTLGAEVMQGGPDVAPSQILMKVVDSAGNGVWMDTLPVPPGEGGVSVTARPWRVPDGHSRFDVTSELVRDGRAVDRLTHEVTIWRPNPNPQFITVRDGDFWLRGRKWYAHGVNYMPSSGIGIEDGEYFEHWLGARSYDPDVIERDLTDCEAMGLNAVSVFQYHRSFSSRNLIDLLIRCRRHELKVNLSLRPGTPMEFPWELVREMIEAGRLAENDDIFVYDLAWEPMWRGHEHRKPYDRDWEAWVAQQHGSIAQAEAAWGTAIPRGEAGGVTNPSDEQMKAGGPWARMVRDYHRFLNHLLHERYGRARELVRSIDPNHSVSFRMNSAGDPTHSPAWPCYDFKGLAHAVDVIEPEGYGRIGDWERVKPGWWTAAYARCAAPGLPVVWAEFGYSACARSLRQATPEKLTFAANYYNDFYTMAYESGANGTFCWWFPGGYRWNERSDYGILNPDRSWRGITEVIHRWSERFTTPRELPRPDVWLEIDRTATSLGIPGFYDQTRDAFWKAVDEGRTPGLMEAGQ